MSLKGRFREWVGDDEAMRDLWMFCTTLIVAAAILPFAKKYFELEHGYDIRIIAPGVQLVVAIGFAYVFGLGVFRLGKNFWGFK